VNPAEANLADALAKCYKQGGTSAALARAGLDEISIPEGKTLRDWWYNILEFAMVRKGVLKLIDATRPDCEEIEEWGKAVNEYMRLLENSHAAHDTKGGQASVIALHSANIEELSGSTVLRFIPKPWIEIAGQVISDFERTFLETLPHIRDNPIANDLLLRHLRQQLGEIDDKLDELVRFPKPLNPDDLDALLAIFDLHDKADSARTLLANFLHCVQRISSGRSSLNSYLLRGYERAGNALVKALSDVMSELI
jgi:hypothetical protein